MRNSAHGSIWPWAKLKTEFGLGVRPLDKICGLDQSYQTQIHMGLGEAQMRLGLDQAQMQMA